MQASKKNKLIASLMINVGTYTTNQYHYDNPYFPHFITSIENGNGVPVARNYYDDAGKLIAVQDANGNLTQFIHDTANNMEVIIDQLGYGSTNYYDTRGNVTAQTNALNQVTTMAYDSNNNKTNEVVYLNGQRYATSRYVYNGYNLLLASTDPLGHTNGFTYDDFGNVLTSSDAKGNKTVNTYDPNNGNLISTTDALTNSMANFYNNGLLTGSQDAVGTTTTNSYDSSGNLTGTATFAADGVTILSTNSFGYDANGNRTNSIVWRKIGVTWVPSVTSYIYDAMNRVVQTIDPDGGTNTVVYDLAGKQVSTIDKLGHLTSYTYDAQGRLFQTTYPDNTTESSMYDANGNRATSTDRLGRVTFYYYDVLNRVTNTTYPDNTTSTTVYDGVGRVAQTIDARGTITAFAYNAAGQRLAVTNAVGVTGIQAVSSFGYDANGNQIYFTNALGIVTTNVFDALNRQVQTLFPDGTKTGTAYDAAGRRVAETNQDGIVTQFGYDGAGRLTSVTNALIQLTQYQYDEAGNEIAQIDALNRTNTFQYDGLGRRIQHSMPGGQIERFSYDLAGNLTNAMNFNGVIITNQYDVMSRLTNRASVNGYKVSYSYTPTGQRATMTDPSGMTTCLYDNRDRLTNKVVNWGSAPVALSVSLNYRYDANGNLTNLWSSTANGVTNVYQYDALNRLTNVVGQASSLSQYTYDLAGNLQTMRYGNGVTNLCQYDSLNRLTNSVWKLNAGTLASFYYQLGLAGNRTNVIEFVKDSWRTNQWQYDPLYRLTNEIIGGASYTSPQSLGYGYDPVGNRTSRTNITGSLNLTNQTFTFNPNDWLTTDQYDNNGNTVSASGNSYQYDALNHVTNMNNAIFITYDGDGNRVKKTVGGTTNYYLLDDRNPSGYVQVLEEWTSTGTPSLSKVYNYGLQLISQRTLNPQLSTNYFICDGHGSTRALYDGGGAFVNSFAYDAYGTLIASNGAPQTAYLYCCQQFDFNMGLYLNRARYWNTGTGRFWTMDSYAGNNEDPLSLHKYLYCQGNPVNMDDPSGHDGTLVELEISTGIGEELDSLQAVSSTAAKRAFTAPIVDIYACMRKFYQTPKNQGDWPLHFWVYANQPGNKGLQYDIDFGGANSGALTGASGQLNVKPDTLQDVKNESWCYKVTSLNEVQYMGWNAFVGLDAATLGEVNAIVDKQTLNYAFEYWLGAGSPMIEHELSKVSNCLIFTIEASSEAKLMSMGR